MSAAILESVKTRLDSLTLIPSRGGCFEVTLDGTKIYSKLATRAFPDHAPILATVAEALKKAQPF